jgi:hypothetical protein
MLELRLVGLNDAGTHVVLASCDGTEFSLALDERLVAAMRRDRAWLGQLQIELEPQLRPREIQSRLRSGESIADVAAAAQVTRDRVERFAGPVLAERQHVAAGARRAPVRRRPDGGPGVQLGEIVAERLEARGVAAETLDWDAWRRDDGRWTIRLGYQAGGKLTCARWVYDPSARAVTCDDDEARWLTEDRPQPIHEPQRPTVPRLVSVPTRAVAEAVGEAAGEAAAEAVARDQPNRRPESAPTVEPAVAVAAAAAMSGSTAKPADQPAATELREERLPAAVRFATPRSDRLTGPTDRHAVKDGVKPGKRATVPSWDEIVFGRRQQ